MTDQPTKIPTGVSGPIVLDGQSYGALLLGRSSASLLGLFVLPGVIDADYTEEIYIITHTPFPPLQIEKGQHIAQLVPLPQLTKVLTPQAAMPHGDQGFGSTGIALLTIDLKDRPRAKVTLALGEESVQLPALLDTGADTSIVSPESWPRHWPTFASSHTVTGAGGLTLARQTPKVILIVEGRQLAVVFSVVPLPLSVACLLGRDVLSQLGIVLTDKHPLG